MVIHRAFCSTASEALLLSCGNIGQFRPTLASVSIFLITTWFRSFMFSDLFSTRICLLLWSILSVFSDLGSRCFSSLPSFGDSDSLLSDSGAAGSFTDSSVGDSGRSLSPCVSGASDPSASSGGASCADVSFFPVSRLGWFFHLIFTHADPAGFFRFLFTWNQEMSSAGGFRKKDTQHLSVSFRSPVES